jgi:AraC-like DNA-binding protein
LENYPKVYLYKRIVQAKLFIDNHFAEKIDLNNIASEASFSKFHFIRLFKNVYGKSPHQYLTTVRLDHAKTLLRSNHSVTEACNAVGFTSLSSFTALFNKHIGESPSRYLSRQQRHLNEVSRKPLGYIPGCFAMKYGWR